MDTGIVGGALVDFGAIGRKAADLSLQTLRGERIAPGSPATKSPAVITADWRTLKRFDLSESRLPPGALVLFRKPTLWEEHRSLILGVVAALLLQSTLITALLVQLQRRRRAEEESKRLFHDLAHVSRVAVMGELTASLAHELNQPLGAILRNAEAAEIFLRSEEPDLDEVRAILTDIRKDDRRAGAVIDRLRSMLKRRNFQSTNLEMGELIAETLSLVRSDAATRQVALCADIAESLPSAVGDRVQLQQVLLNLVMNGIDAMSEQPEGQRRIVVAARPVDAGKMEVSVRDSGAGLAEADKTKLFDSFFTSKAHGLGMGLSICRTIVEAHGGHIVAENNAEGGATFRFTLPTVAASQNE
jgi:C4-dicarboxylate-specific signal transduction histidine kinase